MRKVVEGGLQSVGCIGEEVRAAKKEKEDGNTLTNGAGQSLARSFLLIRLVICNVVLLGVRRKSLSSWVVLKKLCKR